MKEQKFLISLKKSEMVETAVNGVYKFTMVIPDLSLHRKFKIYIKDFIVIRNAVDDNNFYQLKSDTLRIIDNWSSKGIGASGNPLSNDGNTLISVVSEYPSYNSTGSFDDAFNIYNPNGTHNIWVQDHATNAPIDVHEWFVSFVIIGYD